MDATKFEALVAEAVKQSAEASPATHSGIAAAAGAIAGRLGAPDDHANHERIRQLAARLMTERARAEGRSTEP